jgi:hypothetical protein
MGPGEGGRGGGGAVQKVPVPRYLKHKRGTVSVRYSTNKEPTMERLDQGDLHPLLEVPTRDYNLSAGNRTRASAVAGEHSSKD